jgi:hypothetical protein
MLVDKTGGALDKIKAFAAQHNKLEQLTQELEYLANYGQSETQCLLYTDFAPHSLSFVMQRKHGDEWKFWFNGGLIFHSNHDGYGSGSAPTFSCCLNPTDGWSIHT